MTIEPPTNPSPRPSPFRGLNRVSGVLAAIVVIALGVLWLTARPRRTETPAWDPGRFETVRAPLSSASVAQETWAVTVQIRCPHCRQGLERVIGATSASGARVETVALLVDTTVPPDSTELTHVQKAAAVYWDRENIWRGWGGTRWGDVFRFDRKGRFVGMLAPLEDSIGVIRAAEQVARVSGAPAR